MKIGFAYNLKLDDDSGGDRYAEYESRETIDAIADVLAENGDVVHFPCDESIAGRLVSEHPDLVFNIAEGWGGRDRESFVPALCQTLAIPYTGSDATALGITMDKALTKQLAHSASIRVAEQEILVAAPVAAPDFGFPAFVKPLWDGSSRGIFHDSLVNDFESYSDRVKSLLEQYEQPVLVEPYLDGRDFCVGLIGNSPPQVLKNCEVLLGHEDGIPFFSHEYKRRDRDKLDMQPDLPEETIAEMELFSLKLWDLLRLKDYSRFDFRTDSGGTPYLLEINALPGLSPVSGIFIRQAEATGLTHRETIKKILERTLAI